MDFSIQWREEYELCLRNQVEEFHPTFIIFSCFFSLESPPRAWKKTDDKERTGFFFLFQGDETLELPDTTPLLRTRVVYFSES